MSKNRIRITEAQLNNIIKRAITKSFIQEGIMDRLKGAYDGMKYEYNRVKDGNTPSDGDYVRDLHETGIYILSLKNALYNAFVALKKCNLQDVESMGNAINKAIERLAYANNSIKKQSARVNNIYKYKGIQEGTMDKLKGAYYGMKDGFSFGRKRLNINKEDDKISFGFKGFLEKAVNEAYSLLTNCNCKDADNMRQTINRVEDCLYDALDRIGWISPFYARQ